ncbi:serine/threonine-protein kinase [Nocardia seriolae]|uniref:serine/threonine-protein kinase n=1 Tax=Nocardia seriolae TaxID=37332 RepID=UPI00118FB04A|nr:serine/threonine-protein kinase [Nocardia seriolae]GEM27123.1 hypothetical protein NS2_53620 [Nocardia seriolae NBRC 15557]
MTRDQLLSPGAVFAGYRIERVLGRGGMGTVYLVRHPRLPRFEALKVLADGGDPEYRARFTREAELAARLDHPNIVAVRDRGITDGLLWIAMQFVDGFDAAALLRRHPGGVPPRQVLHILEQAARGLDEAHRAGLLHRDVKPANLMLEPGPDRPDRVYVSDFGIARRVAGATPLTEDGSVMATIAYAAPEQLSADVIDHRADVYALGATLYELLTGAQPFPHSNIAAVMQAHLMEPPPRPSVANPALPAALDGVIARAMAKRPQDRYSSCGELAREAARALAASGPPAPVTSTATIRLRRPAPARRRLVWGMALGCAALLVVLAGIVVLKRNSSDSPAAPTGSSASPTSRTLTSSTGSPVTWGAYQFIVQALPALLPAAPIATGYQGIRCLPSNAEGDRIPLAEPLGKIGGLMCDGNRNPLSLMTVDCTVNRRPRELPVDEDPEVTVLRDELWQRTSGSGVIRVTNAKGVDGAQEGFLQIRFDDPARNFCLMALWGGTSGDDLFDRWWRDAPL